MYALVDIDDVVANLVEIWLAIYNLKYNDVLIKDQITDWDLTKFIKQNHSKRFYKIIESPKLYEHVQPIKYALDGVNTLRDIGFEIIYATHSTNGGSGSKYKWLQKHNFWNEKDHYVETKDKFLIRGDLMIDDGWHNIDRFDGFTILFDEPWNRNRYHKNRMFGWTDILLQIEKYKTWKKEKSLIPV